MIAASTRRQICGWWLVNIQKKNITRKKHLVELQVAWVRPALDVCVLQSVAVCCSVLQGAAGCCRVLQCAVVCCSVLQGVAVCCSVLQCVAVCCNVLQCAAVCCSVLQYVAVCGSQTCGWWRETILKTQLYTHWKQTGLDMRMMAVNIQKKNTTRTKSTSIPTEYSQFSCESTLKMC